MNTIQIIVHFLNTFITPEHGDKMNKKPGGKEISKTKTPG